MSEDRPTNARRRQAKVHVPANSLLYNRVVPVLLFILALVTVVILFVVLGVLFGFIPYQ